jgi:tetratricopeptide (TPR) repeat protein
MGIRPPLARAAVWLWALALAAPALGQSPGESGAESLVREAQEMAKAKKYEEAADLMKQAVSLEPSNHLYLAMASDYELKAGKFADGLAHATKAIRLNDRVGAYHVLAAANALGEHDFETARKHCNQVLKGGVKAFGAGPVKDARALQQQLVRKTYTFFWDLDPGKGRSYRGSLPIALPRDRLPYQSASYTVEGARSHRLVRGKVNDILYVIPEGKKSFKLTVKVTVWPYSFKKELAAAAKPLPPAVLSYLGPCATINPRSRVLRGIAFKLKGKDAVETARNVQAWMKANIEYKIDKATIGELDFKSVDEIVERGHAECRGYALLFCGLCRAAGVPARPIWGFTRVAPGQEKKWGDIASHSWAEFYVAGVGWVPIDPQHSYTLGFLPPRHVRVFMDEVRSKTSTEILPLLNLMTMYGDKFKFEEKLAEASKGK